MAAELAFFLLLAIPPAILILAGLAGYAGAILGSDVQQSLREGIVDGLGRFLQRETMQEFVRPAVEDLFARGRGDILSVGAVLALWSASRATRVFMETMNIVYHVPGWRTGWRRRLAAVGVTMGGLVVIAIALPFILAGPRFGDTIADNTALPSWFGDAWRFLYWPAAVVVGVAVLATIYHLAPSRRTPWRRHIAGAALAAAVWVGAAIGLRAYANFALGKGSAFGPLAAPIILLLWLYVSALAVLIGAELNAELGRADLPDPEGREEAIGEG